MASKQPTTKKKLLIIVLVILILIGAAYIYTSFTSRPRVVGPIQVPDSKITSVRVRLKPGANIKTVMSDLELPTTNLPELTPEGSYYLKVPENESSGAFANRIKAHPSVEGAIEDIPFRIQ